MRIELQTIHELSVSHNAAQQRSYSIPSGTTPVHRAKTREVKRGSACMHVRGTEARLRLDVWQSLLACVPSRAE